MFFKVLSLRSKGFPSLTIRSARPSDAKTTNHWQPINLLCRCFAKKVGPSLIVVHNIVYFSGLLELKRLSRNRIGDEQIVMICYFMLMYRFGGKEIQKVDFSPPAQ